ncbi:hypothetical protein [Saccharopolyspora pogona]|nr:hypothetical protein [Saccharopolyspora pogona]
MTGGWIAPLVLLLACSAVWLCMGLLAGRPVQVPSVIGDETPR